eukprot:gene20045-biopygen2544
MRAVRGGGGVWRASSTPTGGARTLTLPGGLASPNGPAKSST